MFFWKARVILSLGRPEVKAQVRRIYWIAVLWVFGGCRAAGEVGGQVGGEVAKKGCQESKKVGIEAMSNFDEVLKKRRSIRRFTPTPIPEEALSAIIDAALSGPSAGNLQAFRVVVVRDSVKKARLQAAALGQESVGAAPVVLVFCADGPASAAKYGERGMYLYAVQDATIACTLAWLKAVDLGLSGVWIGAFYEDHVSRILGLPQGVRPVAILPIGYPGEEPSPKSVRPRRELVIE